MSKYQLICSCVICKQQITVQNIKSHFRTKHEVKCSCLFCGKDLYKRSKFCSNSCSAKFNNQGKIHSSETKAKISKKIKENLPSYTKVKQCPICSKWHKGQGTCSKSCKSILLSIRAQERIAKGWNPNTNRGRGKQSYLERAFQEWVTLTFPDLEFVMEKPFPANKRTYFVDFYFPSLNLIVELDGSQHIKTQLQDQERDKFISETYKAHIIRISHSEFQKKTKLDELWSSMSGSNRR